MSVSSTGTGYTRWPHVEAEIEEISKWPRSEWRRRARRLHSETLVCLVGQIGQDDGGTAGVLVNELSRRTVRIADPAAQGFDRTTLELIVTEVESEIRELILSEKPSRQREFLEVSFAMAVRSRTIDVLLKHKKKPLGGLRSDIVLHKDVEKADVQFEGIEESDKLISDDAEEPIFMNFENQSIRSEIIENLYSWVEDPPCTEALVMVYGHGYSYAEAAQALGTTERQIEYLLVKGKRTMREKLGVQI